MSCTLKNSNYYLAITFNEPDEYQFKEEKKLCDIHKGVNTKCVR